MLPDIDGWEVMQRLQADPQTAAIPVHCVTAVDAETRAFRHGALGYVRKPTSRDELVSVVEALAPRRKGGVVRILIVEDDVLAADSLLAQLEKENVVAERVGTAAEAEQAVRTQKFDCLVVDLGLPDMDGLELLEHLGSNANSQLPSVIVYTARALTAAETRRLEAYTDTIVIKQGASAERLLHEIRAFTSRLASGGRKPAQTARSVAVDSDVRGKKVLVVDDDMRTVYALSALLRAKGFEVEVADTGRTALDMLDKHADIDAVLMDIMMPEMDGYTAMQQIRQQERLSPAV
jgi:CheY-like chemotaxis protein